MGEILKLKLLNNVQRLAARRNFMEKYIVYKTTNLINKYIYIGVHRTKTPYQFDMYLGNGVYINKPDSYERAKTLFQKAVKEFGTSNFYRETLAVFDTDIEAYALEGDLVNEEFLARPDVYNMILGGKINTAEGIHCYQYDENGNYISEYKSYSDAAVNLGIDSTTIRKAVVFKFKVKNQFYFTNVKVNSLNIQEYSDQKIKVYRYKKTGEFDKEYESYADAARDSECVYQTVSRAVLFGNYTRKGYYFSNVKADRFDKARSLQIASREVHKYDNNGNYICSYSSQHEAEIDNPYSNITKAIKLKSIDENGYMWGLEKLKKYNCTIKKEKSKRVGQFDDNGNLLKEWESARSCVREVGSGVWNVFRGFVKTHKGYTYKYL